MNWDEVGAIGQVLGSLAVFITLGYLAIQVRHGRSDTQRSIIATRGETLRQLVMVKVTDERVLNLNLKVQTLLGAPQQPFAEQLMERTGITTEEAHLLWWEQFAWWNYRTHTLPYLHELPLGAQQHFVIGMKGYRVDPLLRLWFDTSRFFLDPDAVRYVDNLLAQPG